MSSRGMNWTIEETILAFDLYCRTPSGKISVSNRDVVELASLLNRTTGAVSLKMLNLAHYDPDLIKRNIKGMSHGSKIDSSIWNMFENDWSELSYRAEQIRAERYKQNHETDSYKVSPIFPEGKEQLQIVKARVNQDFFRKAVLASYNFKCCITNLPVQQLLIASHIKPWKDSDPLTERTDPRNGLLLNSFHDRAFDKGLITIDKKYTIHVSNAVKNLTDESISMWILRYDNQKITLPQRFIPSSKYIEYHNDVIFQK